MHKGTVLVTGASSGIGESLARVFANKQYDLVITARRTDRLSALAEELGDKVNVTCIQADLATDQGVDHLLAEIQHRNLIIDVLVNNAGVSYRGTMQDLQPAEVSAMITLNIGALTRLTHALIPQMVARGKGKILNVSSVTAFQPVPSLSVYAASKAFVLSLTEALSEDLKGTGVTATALCPGLTKTEMVDELVQDEPIPSYMIASADDVAREAYDALMKGEVVRVPGIANQFAVNWVKYQPRWLVRNLGGMFARLQTKKT
jgi:short-subunit dehydrogenase